LFRFKILTHHFLLITYYNVMHDLPVVNHSWKNSQLLFVYYPGQMNCSLLRAL
jgi:hypothetical protein